MTRRKGAGKAKSAPTAASATKLESMQSTNGEPCACLVVVHNDEQNARKTAQLMHDNCAYNLALVQPDTGHREVKIPGKKGTVDPNSLFPPDIAEMCMDDEQSCRGFLTSKSGTTDKDNIQKFVNIEFSPSATAPRASAYPSSRFITTTLKIRRTI
jgi:hypothetical protein